MRFFINIFKRLFSYEVIIGASIYFTLYACFVSYRTLEGKVTDMILASRISKAYLLMAFAFDFVALSWWGIRKVKQLKAEGFSLKLDPDEEE